jgi:hypothetical protein
MILVSYPANVNPRFIKFHSIVHHFNEIITDNITIQFTALSVSTLLCLMLVFGL